MRTTRVGTLGESGGDCSTFKILSLSPQAGPTIWKMVSFSLPASLFALRPSSRQKHIKAVRLKGKFRKFRAESSLKTVREMTLALDRRGPQAMIRTTLQSQARDDNKGNDKSIIKSFSYSKISTGASTAATCKTDGN